MSSHPEGTLIQSKIHITAKSQKVPLDAEQNLGFHKEVLAIEFSF